MKKCPYSIRKNSSANKSRGIASMEMILILPLILAFVLAMTAIAQIMHNKMTVNTETRTAAWRFAQFQTKCAWAVSSRTSANMARIRVTRPLRIDCDEIDWTKSRAISGSASQFLNDMEDAGENEAIKTTRKDRITPDRGGYVRDFARTIEDSGLPQANIAFGEATYSVFTTNSIYSLTDWGDITLFSQFAVEADTKAVWSMDDSHLSKGHNVEFSKRMNAPNSILFPEFFP